MDYVSETTAGEARVHGVAGHFSEAYGSLGSKTEQRKPRISQVTVHEMKLEDVVTSEENHNPKDFIFWTTSGDFGDWKYVFEL